MFKSREEVLNALSQNKGPNTDAMIDALRNNDAKAGEEIANNLLKSYGVSKEQALQMARQRINPKILKMFGF